jgi:hypothetical protein
MPRPRLPEEETIKRRNDKQRKTKMFQNIKRLFSHKEVKDLLNYVPGKPSKYFIPNVSNLVFWSRITDVDPLKLSDDEFKKQLIKSFALLKQKIFLGEYLQNKPYNYFEEDSHND